MELKHFFGGELIITIFSLRTNGINSNGGYIVWGFHIFMLLFWIVMNPVSTQLLIVSFVLAPFSASTLFFVCYCWWLVGVGLIFSHTSYWRSKVTFLATFNSADLMKCLMKQFQLCMRASVCAHSAMISNWRTLKGISPKQQPQQQHSKTKQKFTVMIMNKKYSWL